MAVCFAMAGRFLLSSVARHPGSRSPLMPDSSNLHDLVVEKVPSIPRILQSMEGATEHCISSATSASSSSSSSSGSAPSTRLVLGGSRLADNFVDEIKARSGGVSQFIEPDGSFTADPSAVVRTRSFEDLCSASQVDYVWLAPVQGAFGGAVEAAANELLDWLVPFLSAPSCTRRVAKRTLLSFVVPASLMARIEDVFGGDEVFGTLRQCSRVADFSTVTVVLRARGSQERMFAGAVPVAPDPDPPVERKFRPLAAQYKKIKLLAIDYHVGPIGSTVELLTPFGVQIVEWSFSGHCSHRNSCVTDLPVLTSQNAMYGQDHEQRRAIWKAYRSDPLFESLDGFFCFFPNSLCEAFLPFNKTMIIVAPTRYEQGRYQPHRWVRFNANLRMIIRSGLGVLGGNNLYDQEYIRYFTGLSANQVGFFPDPCFYAKGSYSPNATANPRFLVGHHPSRGNRPLTIFSAEFRETLARRGLADEITFDDLRTVYPGKYAYSDLCRHTAIIHPTPYQLSVMSYMEQYQMGIPLFFPSLDLLLELEARDQIVFQRTWYKVHTGGLGRARSDLPRHPDYDGTLFDPNDEVSTDAMRYWFSYADFLQWPHIILFDSWDDLTNKLLTTDYTAVSKAMLDFAGRKHDRVTESWLDVLDRMVARRHNGKAPKIPPVRDYADAMDAVWGSGAWQYGDSL